MRVLVWDKGAAKVVETPVTTVTRRQAFIVLGPVVVAKLMKYANAKSTPWAMRVAITETKEWHRDAPEIDEIGHALNFTKADIDALFERAAQL